MRHRAASSELSEGLLLAALMNQVGYNAAIPATTPTISVRSAGKTTR